MSDLDLLAKAIGASTDTEALDQLSAYRSWLDTAVNLTRQTHVFLDGFDPCADPLNRALVSLADAESALIRVHARFESHERGEQ